MTIAAAFFSATYGRARTRFLEAACAGGYAVESHVNPRGPGAEGEELATDTALIGAGDAPALLIVSSGTHGVEGFAGSGCQLALLDDDLLRRRALDRGVAILLVHAVNPHGFSHLRRTNEDNIDINRNFRDFTAPPQVNAVYEALHPLLVPESWPPAADGEARLAAEMARLGDAARYGVSGGQVSRPHGLFYGGVQPAWSNDTVRAILRRHGAGRRHIAWIDVHTGLGPYGHGEKIFGSYDEATTRRALTWWGRDLILSSAPDSVSPRTIGHITPTAAQECPWARTTLTTLEYGTFPSLVVRGALRGEAWLSGHPDAAPETAAAVRRAVRDAFYADFDDWKGMVLGQFRALAIQTVNGLGDAVATDS
ncbi:MAG: M14 family metallopeptidase [Rhodospirillales bacterium]|nr:MAG: M14 family metallopeptidase [Rhodospirillales bacterium]